MKKFAVTLVAVLLLLVAPVSSFASGVNTQPSSHQVVQQVLPAEQSKYISNYLVTTYYAHATQIPSTYRYTFVDSNGQYWSGSLTYVSAVAGPGGMYAGVYSGFVYLVQQS